MKPMSYLRLFVEDLKNRFIYPQVWNVVPVIKS